MPITKVNGKKDGLQKYRVRVNYTDSNNQYRQIERTAYGKDSAKELEQKLLYEVTHGNSPAQNITLQQLYDEYVKVKASELREVTLNERKKRIETYILQSLKTVKLTNLTLPRLQKWKLDVENLRKSDGSPFTLGTKQSLYSTFRALLNYAVKMEYIPNNPLVKLGNFKDPYETKPEMDYYTAEEFRKFISAARDEAERRSEADIYEWHYYVFFNIAFYTGMRKGEINALKWSDIDSNTIHIRRSINQQLTGGDRETPPKNKSSIRDIQIPTPLINILDEHKAHCKKIKGFSEEWRICGGERPLRDSTIQKRNELYSKNADVKYIRIHDFRHSHASLLANAGINIQEIARRLGHSNVEITWNTYSHLYPKEEERALQVLNAV